MDETGNTVVAVILIVLYLIGITLCAYYMSAYNKKKCDKCCKCIKKYNCNWITWTGGEPLDQLTSDIVDFFKPYKQAIETSGIHSPPNNLDWVVLSPKINEKNILKKFKLRKDNFHCDELRWVKKISDEIPNTKIKAKKYYISPHFHKDDVDYKNLNWCIKLCLDNPKWSLSMQQHKIWKIK